MVIIITHVPRFRLLASGTRPVLISVIFHANTSHNILCRGNCYDTLISKTAGSIGVVARNPPLMTAVLLLLLGVFVYIFFRSLIINRNNNLFGRIYKF